MAEGALKKLEEQLKCAICLDTYTDPKLLQCFHVYCRECLVKLVVQDEQGQLAISCPTCRQATLVPGTGVTGLQSAFRVNELLEIWNDLKRLKNPEIPLKEANGDLTLLRSPRRITPSCFVHKEHTLTLYCEKCEEVICVQCTVHTHKAHDYHMIGEVFTKHKEDIQSSLAPVEKHLKSVSRSIQQLDMCCGKISDQRLAIEAEVNNSIRKVQERLDARKIELISQLDLITQGKLKGLAAKRSEMKITEAQLSGCLDFVEDNLKTGSQEDILKMKTTMKKQIEEVTSNYSKTEPDIEPDLEFSTVPDLTSICEKFGKIISPSLPDPSRCMATGTGSGLEIATIGEMPTAFLLVFNSNGEPFEKPVESLLQCELISDTTGDVVAVNFQRVEKSRYQINYQPVMKGKHKLQIKIAGQHIRRSPFTIMVKLPLEKLGKPINIISSLVSPRGVAINPRGEIVVTEYSAHRVLILSQNGRKMRSFGKCGSGPGQFEYPLGVAVDGNGNILVADCDNHRIQKFTADGKFITAAGTTSR